MKQIEPDKHPFVHVHCKFSLKRFFQFSDHCFAMIFNQVYHSVLFFKDASIWSFFQYYLKKSSSRQSSKQVNPGLTVAYVPVIKFSLSLSETVHLHQSVVRMQGYGISLLIQ